jgi:hypothetical protein
MYWAVLNQAPIKSRLDRIYTGKKATKHTFEWKIKASTIPTDHWMISVRIAPTDAPYIGKGQWTWPITAINDRKLMTEIEKRRWKLQEDIANLDGTRQPKSNPQTLWEAFKNDITEQAKEITRTSHHKRASRIKTLNNMRKEILDNPAFDENEDLRWEEAIITD